jgi:hypothetical protein
MKTNESAPARFQVVDQPRLRTEDEGLGGSEAKLEEYGNSNEKYQERIVTSQLLNLRLI